MATYAVNTQPHRANKATKRRVNKPEYDPLYEEAKAIADQMWEDAKAIADIIAPEYPVDAEPLDEYDQWVILEGVFARLSPASWGDAEAVKALYHLRKKFTGRDDQPLATLAKRMEQEAKGVPNLEITPANPEYDREMARITGRN